MHFLYIKIPFAKHVLDRTRQLEDKIDQLLRENGAGSVAGWGESLGESRADGSRPVAYTRIDVDVLSLALARTLLQTSLPALGALAGTEIHYTIAHRHCKDIYADAKWLLDPST